VTAFAAGLCLGLTAVSLYLGIIRASLRSSESIKQNATPSVAIRHGPFKMPIRGKKHYISQPLYDMDSTARKDPQVISSPEIFVSAFENYLNWVNPMVVNADEITNKMTSNEHALFAYFELMKSLLTATAYNNAELGLNPILGEKKIRATGFNSTAREMGNDWTFMGATMTGWKRLDNIRNLLQDVIKNNVTGDFIETGVWRGGASVFARAVITAYGEAENRVSYVCDSFAGLPPGERNLDKADANWDNTPYLEVPLEIVTNNFIKYGMLDSNVVFAKGFFNETMPALSKEIKNLAIMRLDGDMYESTVDVLYTLYDKLSIGGYLIMDDWTNFPSKIACEDFFKVHGINPEIIPIDDLSAYWKKTEQVDIEYWRYEQSKFKPEHTKD